MQSALIRVVSALVPCACLAVAAFADIDDSVPDLDAFMAPKADESLLLDGVVVGDRMYVVGERGHALVSDDSGASWRQQAVPTRSTLTGVHFVDQNTGWAVGHDAVIVHTQDGGETWTKQYFDPLGETPLLDVYFADASRGIAVGAYGLYLETDDGGETWTRRPFFSQKMPNGDEGTDGDEGDDAGLDEDGMDEESFDDEDDYVDPEYGEDFHLNHITADGAGNLYIAAELGRFYLSEDGGEVWYRVPVDYGGSFFATITLGDGQLLLAGMRGNLYRSDDRASTLASLDTQTIALLGGGFADENGRVLIGGSGGALLESLDGGQTFTLYGQEDRKGIISVLPADDDAVVLIGEAGVNRLSSSEYRAGGKTEAE